MSKSEIRGRYYAALAEGRSQAEAVSIANGVEFGAVDVSSFSVPADVADEAMPAATRTIDLTDSELREAIKEATGKAPGPRTGREKLIEQFKVLQ